MKTEEAYKLYEKIKQNQKIKKERGRDHAG